MQICNWWKTWSWGAIELDHSDRLGQVVPAWVINSGTNLDQNYVNSTARPANITGYAANHLCKIFLHKINEIFKSQSNVLGEFKLHHEQMNDIIRSDNGRPSAYGVSRQLILDVDFGGLTPPLTDHQEHNRHFSTAKFSLSVIFRVFKK